MPLRYTPLAPLPSQSAALKFLFAPNVVAASLMTQTPCDPAGNCCSSYPASLCLLVSRCAT